MAMDANAISVTPQSVPVSSSGGRMIHLCRDGRPEGPYEESILRTMLARGDVTMDSRAWTVGAADWVPLSAMLEPAIPPFPVRMEAARHPQERRTPGLGVASFVIALCGVVGWFVLLAVAGVASASGAGDESPVMIVVGLLLFAGVGVNLLGAVFGFVALRARGARKALSMIGAVLNVLEIIGIAGVMVIGLMAQ